MSSIPVTVKHGAVTHTLAIDTAQPPLAFKWAVADVTGVPVDRLKIMLKGKVLKDDAQWDQIKPKPGQTFLALGTATDLPKAPQQAVVFLEDLNDSQIADALRLPGGLQNMGNTCYMNSTLQLLRTIPELHVALSSYNGVPDLTAALRDLYQGMQKTATGFPPLVFLSMLRQVNPQFAEQTRGVFAQQDADECWQQIVTSLNTTLPGLPGTTSNGDVPMDGGSSSTTQRRFVEQYMMGEMSKTLTCDEAPEEPPTTSKERILKLDCNISITTNFMMFGIKDSLDQKIEKQSPSLGREAVYTESSRVSRLPEYLTVHMVRFYWRRDINKKAKIMRRVQFPFEFDATEVATPELSAKVQPVQTRIKEIDKERHERRKVRKRTKDNGEGSSKSDELEKEKALRQTEAKELEALVDPDLKADVGSSLTGLYELIALVTHKGASADSGHYIGWTRKDAINRTTAESQEWAGDDEEADKELWYKFDDDKVSVVDNDKIRTLDGGGQDSTAYILLYRSKRLA